MTLTLTENIIRTYARGTLSEHIAGADWYNDAYAIAVQIGNGDAWKGAGVLAALSPREKWDINVRNARRSIQQGYGSGNTFTMNRIATRIIQGAHPLDVLKGDKTRAFASAIALCGQSDIATIDRHAYDIAAGIVHTDKTRPNIGKNVYREYANAYRLAANELSLSVSQVQAITWIIHRREKGIK